MKKRILALALAAVLAAGLCPQPALADSGSDSDFVIENNFLLAYNGPGGDIVIPAEVYEIGGQGIIGNTTLTSVTFLNDDTNLQNGIFQDCTNLVSVTLPRRLKKIPTNMFNGCTSLTHVDIPETVTEISDLAFCECSSLLELTIPAGVTEIGSHILTRTAWMEAQPEDFVIVNGHLLAYKGEDTQVTVPDGVTAICGGAFPSNIVSLVLPDSVTRFDGGAISSCRHLEDITFPDSLTRFTNPHDLNDVPWMKKQGDFPMAGRLLITYRGSSSNVVVPKGVKVIGTAFKQRNDITSVTLPDGVEVIGIRTFESCENLAHIDIPSTLTTIEDYAIIICPKLKALSLPDGLTTLGEYALWRCTALKEITIPGSVKHMGESVFLGCTGLQQAVISRGVTELPPFLFSGCTSLTDISIPSSVKAIGYYAFSRCTALKELVLPSGVTSIGNRVFSGCSSLTDLTIPDSVTDIDLGALFDLPNGVRIHGAAGSPIESHFNKTQSWYPSLVFVADYVPGTVRKGTLGKGAAAEPLQWVYTDTDTLTITSGTIDTQEVVFVACFDAEGRYTGVKALTKNQLSVQLPDDLGHAKLIWLNTDWIPQCTTGTLRP